VSAQAGTKVVPQNSPYTELFNEAIAALIEDGTVAALVEKWFN
jgi:ABC-type amino acid transport substrate-binding protein